MTILITGNPIDGFKYYGPYLTQEDAITEAEQSLISCEADWWIASLYPTPKNEDKS